VVKNHLVLRLLDDVLVHAGAGDQPEDLHLLLLTDPVSSRYRLQVVLRVEVRVVDDHPVGSLKIDSQTSCFCGEKETEVGAPRLVELSDRLTTLLRRDASVQPLVSQPLQLAILLDHVEHDHHLAEDEHPVPGLLEPGEQLVEQDQLAGTVDQLLQPVLCRLLGRKVNLLHQLAVVASLPELHQNVEQAGLLLPLAQLAVVLRQHQLVQLLLLVRHVHPQDLFLLLRHRFLHILLSFFILRMM